MTLVRLGLARDLRSICQDFTRAMPSFDGCPGRGQGSVLGPLGECEFAAWRATLGGGDPVACADVGHVGEDRDALWRADPEDVVGGAARSWIRPGSAGDSYRISSAGPVTTCTFTPCRLCFAE